MGHKTKILDTVHRQCQAETQSQLQACCADRRRKREKEEKKEDAKMTEHLGP